MIAALARSRDERARAAGAAMNKTVIRVLADGQIEIHHNGSVWMRHHFGGWREFRGQQGAHTEFAPREVMDLWRRAVAAALSLNGTDGPSEAEHPQVVDLS